MLKVYELTKIAISKKHNKQRIKNFIKLNSRDIKLKRLINFYNYLLS